MCSQHLGQQRFHCSALNGDQYLNCHLTNWTVCLPLVHGIHTPSHRRHFAHRRSLNHSRQCTITAAQTALIQALLASCTFFSATSNQFYHALLALPYLRDWGALRKQEEGGCTCVLISCVISMPLRTWLCHHGLCLEAHALTMLVKQLRSWPSDHIGHPCHFRSTNMSVKTELENTIKENGK